MNKVDQDPMTVDILTQQLRIRGTVHVHKGSRLTDFINAHKDFIPVTQVQVTTLAEGRPLYRVNFMTVNRQFIVAVLPLPAAVKTSEPALATN